MIFEPFFFCKDWLRSARWRRRDGVDHAEAGVPHRGGLEAGVHRARRVADVSVDVGQKARNGRIELFEQLEAVGQLDAALDGDQERGHGEADVRDRVIRAEEDGRNDVGGEESRRKRGRGGERHAEEDDAQPRGATGRKVAQQAHEHLQSRRTFVEKHFDSGTTPHGSKHC